MPAFPKGYIRNTVILEVLIVGYAVPAHAMTKIAWLMAVVFPFALFCTWLLDSTPPSESGRNNDRSADAAGSRAGARAKPVPPSDQSSHFSNPSGGKA